MKKIMSFLRSDYRKLSYTWSLVALILISIVASVVYANNEWNRSVREDRESRKYFNLFVDLSNMKKIGRFERLSAVMDLSVEFHFDPTIVMIVDHYSREHVDRGKLAWSIVKEHEVMTHIALSLIKVESNGNTFATSKKKAYGLTQLLLPTARDYEPEVTRTMLYDQETNIRIFFMHFERLLEHYEGNMTKVLHGWNRGEGTVDSLLARNIDPANGFSAAIYRVALTNNRARMSF